MDIIKLHSLFGTVKLFHNCFQEAKFLFFGKTLVTFEIEVRINAEWWYNSTNRV